MGQFDRCSVKGCKKKRVEHRGNLSFFRIPKGPEDRQQAWIKFAGRKKQAKKSWKICSTHFLTGKPSVKADNVDYIPSRHPGKKKSRDGDQGLKDDEQTTETNSNAEEPCEDSDDSDDTDAESPPAPVSKSAPSHRRKGVPKKGQPNSDPPSWDEDGSEKSDDTKAVPFKEDKSDNEDFDSEDGVLSYSSSDEEDKETRRKACLCPYCGKDCKWPSRLKGHMNVHGERLLPGQVCDLCGKVLANKYSLGCHMMGVHAKSKNFICDDCGQTFTTKSGLKNHGLQHLKEKPFKCSVCDMSFIRKRMLWVHELRVHNQSSYGKDPLECSVCGMKFILASRLKVHMTKHDEPAHECPHCGRKFRHASNLKTHIKGVHEGDSKYSCQFCFKRFGNQYNLKVHSRMHTGERPYHCSDCSKSFMDICNFRRHQEKCSSGGYPKASATTSRAYRSTKNVPKSHTDQYNEDSDDDDLYEANPTDLGAEEPMTGHHIATDIHPHSRGSQDQSGLPRDPLLLQNKIQTAFAEMLDAGALDARALTQSGTFSLILPH